jgi:hypothetical protein
MFEHLTQDEAAQLLAATLLVSAGLFALATSIAVVYAKKVLKHLSELTGIKVSAENEEKIVDAVRRSIAYAKEQAEKFAAGKIHEGPRSGAEKLEVAKTAARSLAPAALANTTDQQLTIITEAELQIVRPSLPPPAGADSSSLVPRMPPPPTFTTLETRPTPMPPRRNP